MMTRRQPSNRERPPSPWVRDPEQLTRQRSGRCSTRRRVGHRAGRHGSTFVGPASPLASSRASSRACSRLSVLPAASAAWRRFPPLASPDRVPRPHVAHHSRTAEEDATPPGRRSRAEEPECRNSVSSEPQPRPRAIRSPRPHPLDSPTESKCRSASAYSATAR